MRWIRYYHESKSSVCFSALERRKERQQCCVGVCASASNEPKGENLGDTAAGDTTSEEASWNHQNEQQQSSNNNLLKTSHSNAIKPSYNSA